MDFRNIKIIRTATFAERIGACYVRIQAMAVKHHISLEKEFDESLLKVFNEHKRFMGSGENKAPLPGRA